VGYLKEVVPLSYACEGSHMISLMENCQHTMLHPMKLII
jgi:hypothetical protein